MYKFSLIVGISIFLLSLGILIPKTHAQTSTPQPASSDVKNGCLWQICSVDTMKMSRDRARENEANVGYDADIRTQLQLIKDSGANYVALGTPYDEEFVPYLTRWVTVARSLGLHVWFRGNWSGWEGWFDYPKTVTPEQHLQKTATFIKTHPDLFQNGDIFDACPECEGSGKWPQPIRNQEYLDFIKDQHATDSAAFKEIGKDVITDIPTMIGGHARDVMDQQTIDALNHHVAIDHYVKDLENMQAYINYFRNEFNSKVVVSEFGAPIPDINGDMTEDQQAAFVDEILQELYKQKGTVIGLNYFVLNDGSTRLLNDDGSKRKVYDTLRSYFMPQTVKGTVTNTLGDPLRNITITAGDGVSEAKTDGKGKYVLVMPAKDGMLSIDAKGYTSTSSAVTVSASREAVMKDFVVKPLHPDAIYQIREFLVKVRLDRVGHK